MACVCGPARGDVVREPAACRRLAARAARPRGGRRVWVSPRATLSKAVSTDGFMKQLEEEQGYCNLNSKYSPELVRSRALESPRAAQLVMARAVEVVAGLGGYGLKLLWDYFSGVDTPGSVRARAAQLRLLLCALGPTYVKAGQVLANRPDIIRQDFMAELCLLQDDVPAFSTATAFAIVEAELGRPLESVFSRISPAPVAAASLGQVYRATLRDGGAEVAVKVQRPGIEPIIMRDLFLFRALAQLINPYSLRRLGCNAQLIVDEFGEKLLEELDYLQEARNIADFGANFGSDPTVKIPVVYPAYCGPRVLVLEWIDGIRCTDPAGIRAAGIDLEAFIQRGVVSGLRQLLEFGLFHGDPHPGNIFALRDGRIAYVDFGNVAELSLANKQVLIDAVVHAVNEDYREMAGDFVRLGFLAPGTDVAPIIPALESIWSDCLGQTLSTFNFRTVTSRFNELVFQYPIRIPERFSLVIRALLTQEGICMTLQPDFKFLEVAYPYIAKRLLTDDDPELRSRLLQVLFHDGRFQWARLENLIALARGGGPLAAGASAGGAGELDLTGTVTDSLRVLLLDGDLRTQLLLAVTEDDRLHVAEVASLLRLLQGKVEPSRLAAETLRQAPALARKLALSWADKVLA